MVVNVSSEQVAKFDAERKARIAARDAEEKRFVQECVELKLANDAYWNKVKSKTVTVRKSHVCEKCAGTISAKTKAHIRSVVVGTGWPFSLVTKYSHAECSKR